ncbi:MAG: DUF3820 family protein [Simkaniaceae bacterium]|nr:DUF3820 family protein [Simkaniaceae bacterium]
MTKRAIFYDTETTGVRPESDRIIEIAAYDPAEDKTFLTFVNPGLPIPEEASALHKITDDMVSDAPSFAKAGEDFKAFCRDDAVLIAHNNDAFDLPFLRAECKRHDLTLPPFPSIDSLKFARKYRPDLPRHSLQHLREYHGIPPNRAHRALDDVIVLHRVFCELIDDLSIETVLELMAETTVLHHMPFGKHRGKPLREVPVGYIRWLSDNNVFDKVENRELKKAFVRLGMLNS